MLEQTYILLKSLNMYQTKIEMLKILEVGLAKSIMIAWPSFTFFFAENVKFEQKQFIWGYDTILT